MIRQQTPQGNLIMMRIKKKISFRIFLFFTFLLSLGQLCPFAILYTYRFYWHYFPRFQHSDVTRAQIRFSELLYSLVKSVTFILQLKQAWECPYVCFVKVDIFNFFFLAFIALESSFVRVIYWHTQYCQAI